MTGNLADTIILLKEDTLSPSEAQIIAIHSGIKQHLSEIASYDMPTHSLEHEIRNLQTGKQVIREKRSHALSKIA